MTALESTPAAEIELPSALRLGFKQAALEVKVLLRSKDLLLVTLGLPLIYLFVFGLVIPGEFDSVDVSLGQWFTPGIIAASVLSAGAVNMATTVAMERHDGTLRRLALTPLPTSSYLIGKILLTLATATAMTIVLLAIGAPLYDVAIPTELDRWLTFTWVFLLGVISATVLGIALSALPRSAKSAGPMFNISFVLLMFISGIFFQLEDDVIRTIAGVFPLRWLAAGMRAVFLPDEFEAVEPGGSYYLGWAALVLSIWVVVGFALAARTFRWGRER